MMEKKVLRNELKYYISRPGAAILKSRLSKLMYPDSHAEGFEPYFIRSVYFDDVDYTAYRDKLSGVEKRDKYRVRFYNMDTGYMVFEQKKKIADKIQKTSQRIDMGQMRMMMKGLCVGESKGLLGLYDILCKTKVLKPLVIVDYHRTVFSYPISNVRITLDENIRAKRFAGDAFNLAGTVPVIDENSAVLEVKFDNILPPQIKCLFEDIPKNRSAVSKYCLCCETL